MVLLFAVALCALAGRGKAGADPLPMPRKVYDDDGDGFSPADFERLLLKLRAEREGLSSDWQALRKRNTTPEPSLEMEQKRLEKQIQRALEGLKRGRQNSAAPVVSGPEPAQKKTEPDAPEGRKSAKPDAASEAPAEKSSGAVDVLAQAHTLVRSKQYEEALATFQQVDLKGKKANERAPVQYLKACCMLHLGKNTEAAELLQEVANYRGDEKLADYAQWHLEMLRWQRDVAQRLQEIRQRHQPLENRR
jgi:anion-transporting  ArsA/GET3 family ATPase